MTYETCVLYARVSNKSQAERGLSLPEQFRELRAWAERESYRVVEEVSDTGGKDSKRDVLDRPGINRILDLCERQRVDSVIAQSRDRLGEYPIPDMLAMQLSRYGTKLRTPDDSEEGEDAEIANMFRDWMACRERRTTARRSRSRKLEHVRAGYVMAGHTPPYGFRFAGTKNERTLAVHPQHMEVVRRIFRMAGDERKGAWAVKRTLDDEGVPTPPNALKDKRPELGAKWARQYIRKVIDSDAYKPHTREEVAALVAGGFMLPEVAAKAPEPCCIWWYEGKDYEGKTHRVAVPIPDAGIPREWVDAARVVKGGSFPTSRSKNRPFWELKGGVLFCGGCGRRMKTHSIMRRARTYYYYECTKLTDHGKGVCPKSLRLSAERVEETVWNFVAGILSNPQAIVEGIDKQIEQERLRLRTDPEREEMALLNRRGALEEERRGYLRQNARGVIGDAELDEMLAGIEERRQEIDRSLVHLRERGERLRMLEETRQAYAQPEAWARDAVDGWIRDDPDTDYDVPTLILDDRTGEPMSLYEANVAILAGDYAPERLRTIRRDNLNRFTAERRHERYREMALRVVAHSKEELEITGVFGTVFVSPDAHLQW
jgi:site-specific DNA recombinase